MQRRDFGTSAMTRPTSPEGQVNSAAGAQYRRRAEDYNTATRLLRRRARRGDSRSALALLDVGRDAAEEGFSPGGIRRRDDFNRGLLGSIEARAQAARDLDRGQMANRMVVDEIIANPAAAAFGRRRTLGEDYDTGPDRITNQYLVGVDGPDNAAPPDGEPTGAITPVATAPPSSSARPPATTRDLTLAEVSQDLDKTDPSMINGELSSVWTRRRKRLFDRSPY